MARKDLWRWLWVFFVLLLGFPAYLQGGGGVNGRRTTSLHNGGDSRPTRDILSKPPLPICQVYQGRTCEAFLMNQTVFVTPGVTIDTIEERLKAAYGVIKESKDMNPNCRVYALPSLCYSILPTCRSPELSNHQYFAAKATYEANQRNNQRNSHKRKRLPLSATKRPPPATTPKLTVYFSGPVTPAVDAEELQLVTAAAVSDRLRRRRETFDVTVDARTKAIKRIKDSGGGPRVSEYTSRQYPPTRNTENLRRICRDECELLENELCQKEYAIAKRHPAIGKLLQLEECTDLPDDSDCMSLGIAVDVAPEETCFWENGEKYRGTVATSASGRPCLKWARLMKEIADFPELAGQNFCRNPGGMHPEPWCFVENISVDKVIESCSIPRCSERMWLYVIISFVSLAMGILCVVCLVCCKKWRKRGMTNIQNINLPSADKNIYGNSRLNSPMEMASLLPNVSGDEQAENASNFGGSRKGSTFSISASNRGQVVTPSSSSQHSLGRADAEQGPPKERSNSTSGNMASLERGHHHHHHHHHQSLERDREGSFSHHHHHSKSRLSNASNSNLSIGGTPGTTFASDEHLHEPQRRQKGTKEKHHHHHHRQRLNSGTDSTERSRKSDPDVEIPSGRKSSVASVKSADRDAVLMISPSKRLPPPYPQF
uniref:Putative tyrosine-protein kinase transmembrane receptor ror n=1 Tax=Lutzomyia longipalpis TaxID=7200 RepID=A0A1B0CUW9_LUTLO